ncbi:MtnX-like HAD-IB family phosphatase [Microvirga alba]|uniref:MtnX-like HAD-IB family phosphatase n=1 Tax=Microvirga alba TaxID=2791025 RepID=A0A931BPW5_9HYPH|nr:MtnX-like HAD-IB family phosphatase [Microvirga alba]MBF9235276.1 MtnX-like HAD-IB family phosphatase [Microvirga alba]
MYLSPHVYIDFDGTISLTDTTDLLLQHFAAPEWQEIEAAWERGEIGSQECMIRQISLLNVSPNELDCWLETIPLDPAFSSFVRFCEQLGFPVTIVSDGLDRTIKTALRRLGLTLPVVANHLEWLGETKWKLGFPFAREGCRSLAGHCKCSSMAETHGRRVLIGDGRSDFCAAERADIVFAKGKLLAHCRATGLQHLPYATFSDLQPTFMRWIADLEATQLRSQLSLTQKDKDHHHAD